MSSIARGWRRNFEVYSVMLISLFGGATIVNRFIMKPNMEVPAALNLDYDAEQLLKKERT